MTSLKTWTLGALFAAAGVAGGCDDGDGGGASPTMETDLGAAGDAFSGSGDGGEPHSGADAGADAGGAGGVGGGGGGGEGGGAGGEGGGAGGPSAACAAACERLQVCTAEVCVGDAAADILESVCADTCDAQPTFPTIIEGTPGCGDVVAYGRQTLGAAFGDACVLDPGNLPTYPECAAFGARVVACMTPRCPPIADDADLAATTYRLFCDQVVAAGQLAPADLGAYINASTPCDAPQVVEFVTEQIDGADGAPGGMADYCAEGSQPDEATCRAACEVAAPCLPLEGDAAPLRNEDRCVFFCMSDRVAVGDAVWTCAAEADACPEALACFTPAPAPENCGVYSDRVAACVAEACPATAERQASVAGLMESICASGEIGPAVDTVTADTPCDEAFLAGSVQFLTVDAPETPDDGLLTGLCEGAEPANPPELCATACAHLGPCIPEGSDGAALRDVGVCEIVCALGDDDIPPEMWQCVEAADGCEPVGACFGG